jgi:hypothetical protein
VNSEKLPASTFKLDWNKIILQNICKKREKHSLTGFKVQEIDIQMNSGNLFTKQIII